MIVIILYLLFTIFEADWQLRQQGDFYTALGVPPDADERTIQSKFRKLYVLLAERHLKHLPAIY